MNILNLSGNCFSLMIFPLFLCEFMEGCIRTLESQCPMRFAWYQIQRQKSDWSRETSMWRKKNKLNIVDYMAPSNHHLQRVSQLEIQRHRVHSHSSTRHDIVSCRFSDSNFCFHSSPTNFYELSIAANKFVYIETLKHWTSRMCDAMMATLV